ncbi:MAG TPA: hypothetical protein VKE22_11025, partial [Haliangiales bacterium]|nr:hypothetical protein [Haliangiales bacterium]
MTCAELQERSLALATLPDGDPELVEAEAHALSCPACADALAQARDMLRLLDRHGAPPPPSGAALRRARAPIAAELRGGAAGRVWPAVAAAVGFALVALLAKHRVTEPAALVGAALALAVAALRAAGLPWRSWLGLGVTLGASALFAGVVGGPGELDPMLGVKCMLLENVAASLPLATTAVLLWRRRAPAGALVFACVAAAGALAGQAALHL